MGTQSQMASTDLIFMRLSSFFHFSCCLNQLDNHFHLYRDLEGQGAHADGGSGMPSGLAKNLEHRVR